MKNGILLSLSLMLMLMPINSLATVNPTVSQIVEPSTLTEFNFLPNKIRLLTAQNTEVKAIEEVKEKYPKFDIPLSEENQLYAYGLSEEFNIPIEFIYAIANLESDGQFEKGKRLVHRNNNGTSDYGMMQLNNGGTMQWLAKSSGISSFDWSNPKHSLRAGVWYLDYLRNQWIENGYKDSLMELTALSYNMGMGNATRYIKNHDVLDWKYVKKAITYEDQLKGEIGEM